MAPNSFAPNTRIESAKVNQNFTNFSDHSLHFSMVWTFIGTLTTQTSPIYLALPDDGLITRVDLVVTTAPTGQAIIADVERSTDSGGSWTTIFTGGTNRPQIAASSKTGNTTTIDVPSATALTHLYRAKISQVGSSVVGADCTVMVRGQYVLD